ncbi:MAG: Flp family type IVb pilin [Candidatus Tectimicrobiota bacterium]
MITLFKTLLRDEEAASAVEYGLLVALIAAVIIASVTLLGGNIKSTFENVATTIGGGS